MNDAKKPRAGALQPCVCPGPPSSWPRLTPSTLASQQPLLASIHGTWPAHSRLARQTDPFVPNDVGVEETDASAVWWPESVIWEKVGYSMGDRRAHPQGQIPGSRRVTGDVFLEQRLVKWMEHRWSQPASREPAHPQNPAAAPGRRPRPSPRPAPGALSARTHSPAAFPC